MEISCLPVQGTFLICSHTCTFVWNPEHLNKTGAVSIFSLHSILSVSHTAFRPGIFSFKFDIGLGSCCAAATRLSFTKMTLSRRNTIPRAAVSKTHSPRSILMSSLTCTQLQAHSRLYVHGIEDVRVCLLGSLPAESIFSSFCLAKLPE
jgi:hypothetical protein